VDRCVVSIAVDVDERFFELRRSDAGAEARNEQVQPVTGGQLSAHDADRIVDPATATRAALSFARDGKPDPGVRWHEA